MEEALKIRKSLADQIRIIRLAASLMPPSAGGGLMNPIVRDSINETIVFINEASWVEILVKGSLLLKSLEPILQQSLKYFPLKQSIEEVAAAFGGLVEEEGDDMFSRGIPFSWLDKHIDTGRILVGYTPYQAKIGIGYHAGKYALEESFLLSDGFFLLVSAERTLRYLLSLKEEAKISEKDGYASKDFYEKASAINHNVSSLARNSVVNLYSFIECFVNSVGYDFCLRNETSLLLENQDILKGKKDGFLSLEYKMEKFPLIINANSKQIIFTLDAKQRKEPFMTFF